MTPRTSAQLLLLLLAAACGDVSPPASIAAGPVGEPSPDYALAQPIFESYYSCGEHREGELEYLGDALGADCVVQELEEIGGRTFARSYRQDGSLNEHWYGWGRAVLSPCSCEVVKLSLNGTTNQPGVTGEPPATFVVLRRDDQVHFLLAHLDATTIEVGDRVVVGQKLGVVGNNGYGRNPHVHMGAWRGDTPLQIRFDLSEPATEPEPTE